MLNTSNLWYEPNGGGVQAPRAVRPGVLFTTQIPDGKGWQCNGKSPALRNIGMDLKHFKIIFLSFILDAGPTLASLARLFSYVVHTRAKVATDLRIQDASLQRCIVHRASTA